MAAGGGGDAITAAVLGRRIGDGDLVAIMSYSWDRLMVDPLPGPRSRSDFVGLEELGPSVFEIRAGSRLRQKGTSTLPRLADDLGERLLLLDPSTGSNGVRDQISCAAYELDIDNVLVVDVGGDILARGSEAGLRTPLADSLSLAACAELEVPTRLWVCGLGLDGELTMDELNQRLDEVGTRQVATLRNEDFDAVRTVFDWHPSEATGLLAAAASGLRGNVETRQGQTTVAMTDVSTIVYKIAVADAIEGSLAADLIDTSSLADAECVIRKHRGSTEIDFERQRSAERSARSPLPPTTQMLPRLDRYTEEARVRGVDFLTFRRVAEFARSTDPAAGAALRELLAAHRPDNYAPPLYRTASGS
ncbi:DUF1152 domain-containing protein [Nocardia sp. BMG51109]|uniref:DUF1152 domain-containing protein n=1 Tax=Nocardia sp. BMG51109 TaxID=1056816 RepID=UPI000464752E|nr:DUF1152 domain-containing protein [Nocardia sp. BMG51109]